MSLSARQQLFVAEYLVDLNGKAAAIRAGYSGKSAKSVEVQAVRLLGNARVRAAIEKEMQARRDRLQVDADRVVLEYAKIAFANIRDYIPRQGEELDLRRLNCDQTAAIENINLEETYDVDTRDIHRRIQIKMHDKVAALNVLAKHLGLLNDRREDSLERRVARMTPAERLARVEELRAKARDVYLPLYEKEQQAAKGQPTINWTVTDMAEPANDNVVRQDDELTTSGPRSSTAQRCVRRTVT